MTPRAHILVAEDERMAAAALREFLELMGYRVTIAEDGVAAVAAYDKDPADMLLTDIRMPRKDGLALIAELCAKRPDLPVVIMTGNMLPATFSVEPCARPTTVFIKPVRPNDLLEAIKVSLAGMAA